jgi:flagellar biosynthesis/type III secretory pathway protein FliH
LTVARAGVPAKQTTDDQEFLMDTQDIVEHWRREAIQEGVQQGIQQGFARSLIALYEARFGTIPKDVRAVVEGTRDETTLLTWVTLAGTRSANEIVATIRASRAS